MKNLESYKVAEAQLHVATQMIALTGKNLIKTKSDDSHTTAQWDDERKLIIGQKFESDGKSFTVFVDPIDFALGVMTNGRESERLLLDNLSYVKTLEPWKQWLTEAGIQKELNLSLHYELPSNDLYVFNAFKKPNQDILNQWSANRTLANKSLSKLTNRVGVHSDINIWPHHFDSGTYYELHKTNGETDRSIGAGFNPADEMVDQPYFYIYAWRKDVNIDYSDIPKLKNGKWIIKEWKGAVLPISEVANIMAADKFFEDSFTYLKTKLI